MRAPALMQTPVYRALPASAPPHTGSQTVRCAAGKKLAPLHINEADYAGHPGAHCCLQSSCPALLLQCIPRAWGAIAFQACVYQTVGSRPQLQWNGRDTALRFWNLCLQELLDNPNCDDPAQNDAFELHEYNKSQYRRRVQQQALRYPAPK